MRKTPASAPAPYTLGPTRQRAGVSSRPFRARLRRAQRSPKNKNPGAHSAIFTPFPPRQNDPSDQPTCWLCMSADQIARGSSWGDVLLAWHHAPSDLCCEAFPTSSSKKSVKSLPKNHQRGIRESSETYRNVIKKSQKNSKKAMENNDENVKKS